MSVLIIESDSLRKDFERGGKNACPLEERQASPADSGTEEKELKAILSRIPGGTRVSRHERGMRHG